jgi:Family of unknown function (DUF6502)
VASIPNSRTAGEHLLSQCVETLTPLVRLLIANGVGYGQVTVALKQAFIQAAEQELNDEGRRKTEAAISLRSGVHRKEVRARAAGESVEPAVSGTPKRALSLAEQVFTRWLTDASYQASNGRPSPLPASGPAPSFESLATSVTKDFSRRTILDELVRLGLVREDLHQIVPLSEAMVPRAGSAELVDYFTAQIHDHMAAGVANLRASAKGEPARFLEQSMYANGISDASIEYLAHLARAIWKPAFEQMVGAASQRFAVDRAQPRTGRLRFGVYVYSEPDQIETEQ